MIALLLNHLWQSSLFAAGAGLIALALKGNGANVRFWLWFAASVKFLVPFALLTTLGAYVLTPALKPLAPVVQPLAASTVTFMQPLAQPFSAPPTTPVTTRTSRPTPPAWRAPPHGTERPAPLHLGWGFAFLALWAAGFTALALRWFVRWRRIEVLVREAVEVPLAAPVAVKSSASRLEPGLFGILDPVILLPRGIERQLSPAELRAVLAHELCHWRRRDNLLAAIHMTVEALFWFFPLVWWLGARLNEERERACDEGVLADGNDPKVYAEGILSVCRAYLQSPLPCVAGVSGADLKKRIETIMEARLVLQLNAARKFLLGACAALALVLPLALGLMAAPAGLAKVAPAPDATAAATAERILASALKPAPAMAQDQVGALEPHQAATPGSDVRPPSPARAPLPALPPQPIATSEPPAQPNNSAAAAALDNQRIASNQEAVMYREALAASLALLGMNGAAGAQTVGGRTCSLPQVVDTVALEPVAQTGLMTVPVQINGSTRHFLLDIGTGPTEISQPTVAALGLPQYAKLTEGIGAQGSDLTNRAGDLGALTNGGLGNVAVYDVRDKTGAGAAQTHIRVASFGLGRANAKSMIFLLANDAEMGKTEPYDGLLTGDFFRKYDVELDFAGKQVNWLTPTKCTDPDQVVFWSHTAVGVIPITMVDGKMQVPVMVGDRPVNAVIDTSSSRTVMRRDIAELVLGLKAGTDMTLDTGAADGKGQPVYLHTFPQISFTGGVTANNVPALIMANSPTRRINSGPILGSWARSADAGIPDLTLGMDVLHQLHMYVVPGQQKVYVTAAE